MKKKWVIILVSLIILIFISSLLFLGKGQSHEGIIEEEVATLPAEETIEEVQSETLAEETVQPELEADQPKSQEAPEPPVVSDTTEDTLQPVVSAEVEISPEPDSDMSVALPTEVSPIDLPYTDDFLFSPPVIYDSDPIIHRKIIFEELDDRSPEELQPMSDELLAIIIKDLPETIGEPEIDVPLVAQITIVEPQTVEEEEVLIDAIPEIVEIPPALYLEIPVDQKFYRSLTEIRFFAFNDSSKNGNDRISQVYWSDPQGAMHDLIPDDDGHYAFSYDSSEHKGPLVLKVTALKDNGLTDELLVELDEDVKGPSILIEIPLANDAINDVVLIEGSLYPENSDYAPVDEVSSLSLILPGFENPLAIQFEEDGRFSFELKDHGIEGMEFLTFEALDKNSHKSSKSIPIIGKAIDIVSEAIPPRIDIQSPEADSLYYSKIEIRGSVTNGPDESQADEIEGLYWSLAGEEGKNKIDFRRDGSFQFRITAVDMNSDLQILFTAEKSGGVESNVLLPLKNDREGPAITLESPVADQYFSHSLKVKGRVEDYVDGGNEVKSLYWSVSSRSDERNLIFFEDDGSFDFDLNTEFLEGKVSFRISAADLNDNRTDLSVELNDGKKAPIIRLDSPEADDQYGAGIRISGKISDPYSWNPDFGGLEELTVSLSPADAVSSGQREETSIPLSSSGTFEYILPATGRTGDQNLELAILALNGNRSVERLTLSQSEYAIPDLFIKQGDGRLELSWTEMPFIESYNLSVRYDDSDRIISSVKSPLLLSDLVNGKFYEFHLTGVKGLDLVESPVLGSIPLTEKTLEPIAQSEFGYVEISWISIEGTSAYKVLRAEDQGEYIDISGEIYDSRFIDKSGIFGRRYSYRVVPYGYEQIPSYSVEGELLSEPPLRLTEKGSLENIEPQVIVIDGDYGYVVSRDEGFYIVDISNPEKLSVRGFLMIQGGTGITLIDDYAVVTAGPDGFHLINISEPASPRIVSSRKTSDALAADASGEYVYIADGVKGLKIYSLSNPLRPPRITADDAFPAYDLYIEGNLLYLCSGEYGLNIIDISDPYYPQQIAYFDEVAAFHCEVRDSYAFIASREKGISIVDVSDTENLKICSTYKTEDARSVSLRGNHLLIADGEGGLIDIDITDPYRPVSFESMDLAFASSVDSGENIVVVADRRGLKTVESFQFGQSFKIGELVTEGIASSVEVHEGLLYISDHGGGLVVVDGSNPANIDYESILYTITTDYAESAFISNGRLYLADGLGGVRTYALKDNEMIHLETIVMEGQVRTVFAYDGYLYAAAGRGGVQGSKLPLNDDDNSRGLDESLPLEADDRELKKTALWAVPLRDTRDLIVVGSYLYSADRQRGLVIMETKGSDPPEIVREIELPGSLSITHEGDKLYIAHGKGVSLFSMDDPEYPDLVKTLESPYVEDIYVEGSILYIAEGHAGLSIYEVKDDDSIIKVSECLDVFADSVTVSGEYAYVADSTGINIVKIHIPQWIRQRQ